MLNLRLLFAVLVCLFLYPAPCWSQGATDRQLPDFDELEQDLDWSNWLLENAEISQSRLDEIRNRVESILDTAGEAGPKAEEEAASLKNQLEALGTPPDQGTGQESSEIASRRQELQNQLARQQGYLQRIELIKTRGEEILKRIAQAESKATARVILSGDANMFTWEVWNKAARQAGEMPTRVWQLGASTLSAPGFEYYAMSAAIAVGLVLVLRVLLLRSVRPHEGQEESRYLSALVVLVANGVLPALGLIVAFLPLLSAKTVDAPQARLLESVLAAGAALLIARAWIHVALFSTNSPRLIRMDERLAITLARWLYVLTGVAILSFFFYQMARADIAGTEFYRCTQLVLRVAIALLFLHMFPVIRRAMQSTHETDGESSVRVIREMYGTLFLAARIAVPGVLVVNPVLLGIGYWRLSDWLFFGVVGSCLLLMSLWLIRNALREFVSHNVASGEGARPQGSPGSFSSAIVWGIGLSNLLLWLGTMICLFLIWGVPALQINTWTHTLLFTNLSLSGIGISAADVLIAVTVFFALLLVTRLVQRQLQKRVLSWAPIDIGVRNALWSATGYLGILAAAIASLMALGIDLSQLFLILGALSVGIGFGLQSVVHDFISGLILLFERPVRIGDWITVEGEEGMVKRIGPRVSLLKTTLDGDIWIPNSKLTSSHVTNWTLASHAGHIRIASALNRDTDERRASEIILETAGKHPSVAMTPKPEVFMERMDGESCLLTLHAVVGNIADRFSIESDLRFSLKNAFRNAGIEYSRQSEEDSATSMRAHTMPGKYALGRS